LKRKGRELGNEAPLVITPRAIVQLVRDTVAVIRRRKKS
jgi:hypothetical protein